MKSKKYFVRLSCLCILLGVVQVAHAESKKNTLDNSLVETPNKHLSIINAFATAKLQNPDSLLSASFTLSKLGAQPVSNTPDMANEWRQVAHNSGLPITQTFVPVRGRAKGPAYRRFYLETTQIDELSEVYHGAEKAQVTLASSSSAFELIVHVGEKTVCKMLVEQTPKTCSWTPLYTAPHTLKVTNKGEQAAHYLLVSN